MYENNASEILIIILLMLLNFRFVFIVALFMTAIAAFFYHEPQ
jgi:hypothetical protein